MSPAVIPQPSRSALHASSYSARASPTWATRSRCLVPMRFWMGTSDVAMNWDTGTFGCCSAPPPIALPTLKEMAPRPPAQAS